MKDIEKRVDKRAVIPENKQMKLLLLSIVLLLAGCSANREMRDVFGDGKIHILMDKAGNKYAVRHTLGDNYYVVPLKDIINIVNE